LSAFHEKRIAQVRSGQVRSGQDIPQFVFVVTFIMLAVSPTLRP